MHILSCENEFYLHENEKIISISKAECALNLVFLAQGNSEWPTLSLFSFYMSVLLACSSDIFCRCANVFAHESTMLKLQKRGKSKGGAGGGGREWGEGRENACLFFFLPSSSSPLSFFLSSTYLKGYYFYSLQCSSVIKSKMAAKTIRT